MPARVAGAHTCICCFPECVSRELIGNRAAGTGASVHMVCRHRGQQRNEDAIVLAPLFHFKENKQTEKLMKLQPGSKECLEAFSVSPAQPFMTDKRALGCDTGVSCLPCVKSF